MTAQLPLKGRSEQELQKIAKEVSTQLKQAAKGTANSLAFIPHRLPKKNLVEPHEVFQVFCVGGSNLQMAQVKTDKKIQPISLAVEKLPLMTQKEDLFDVLVKFVRPTSETIAFNFAYPMIPINRNGLLDGRLLTGTKEHQLKGLVGKVVGAELTGYLKNQLHRDIKIPVANDTVCLTLAGLGKARAINLVSLILGTGCNTGTFIDDQTVINCESGNFSGFNLSESGRHIDERSVNPGRQWFEKEVAGAYLYQHFNFYAQAFNCNTRVETSQQVNEIAELGLDRPREIAQFVVKESAKLVAALLAGYVSFKQKSLTVIAEGGIYLYGYRYQKYLLKYLNLLAISNNALTFIHLDNSSILGAARLVVTNNA